MSETGQPGAATPGEHGDGTGPQDDLARSGGGWAPPTAGWSRGGESAAPLEAASRRRQPDSALGWAASSPWHGDLPAPLPGLKGDGEPPARVNGHRTNGVPHDGADAPVARHSPVSAPPGLVGEPRSAPPLGEPRRDSDGDRLAVPAQRPAPPVEQPSGSAEPATGPAGHASEDSPTGRPPRWAEPGLPTSAPPAVQVPPVGTAASGFEVPPGFHAPTADRSRPPEPLPGADEVRGRRDGFPPEPAALDPHSHPAVDGPRVHDSGPDRAVGAGGPPDTDRAPGVDSGASGDRAGLDHAGLDRAGLDHAGLDHAGLDRAPAGDRVFGVDRALGGLTGGDRAPGPGWRAGPDREPGAERASGVDQPRGGDRASEPEPGADSQPAERSPAAEPDWSGPNWNRPSWGSAWAPPWAREEPESSGRRSREEPESSGRRFREEPESSGRRSREEPESSGRRFREEPESSGRRFREEPESSGRRFREERPAWAADRPYEPLRADPHRPDPVPRVDPGRPYDLAGAESAARAPYEPAVPVHRSAPPVTDRSGPSDRAAWVPGRPSSAPPAPFAQATSEAAGAVATPGADDGTAGSSRPFRLRPAGGDATTAEPSATAVAATGPGTAPASSGAGRRDHPFSAPAPTSAPPYAARRSAPEPAPTADPADDRLPDRTSAVLPQRVPAEPDVPVVPEPPAVEPPAETPELARIATHLRRDDETAPLRDRPEGFDVDAILAAVRGVAGVRDAELRRTPAGAHSLRLDLADGADPAEVSRQVARLLQERMGLAAAPQNVPGMPAAPTAPVRRRSADPPGAARRSAEARPAEAGPTARGGEASTAEPRVPGSRAPADRSETLPARDEQREGAIPETPRRRRQSAPHRGRATVEEPGSITTAPAGTAAGSPAVGTAYSGGQVTTTETAPSRPLDTGGRPGPRVVIDHVQVSTFGLDATVEVRLVAGRRSFAGHSTGPAVDGYVLRLCAVAAAAAVDELLRGGEPGPERGRCFVEHAAVVPFGNCEVATVVVLLVCDGWVEQLAGSALVAGDPRQAVVRATLAAVNRRLEALLA